MNRKRRLPHNTHRDRDDLLEAMGELARTMLSGAALVIFMIAVLAIAAMASHKDNHQDMRRIEVRNV